MEKNFAGLADSATEKRRDVVGSSDSDDNKTNNTQEELVIKSEITIEPEEVTQMHIAYEYDFRQTNEPIMQVEVYADAENFVEKDDILLPQGDSTAVDLEGEQKITENTIILSDVMSDHNYISQELVENENTIGNIRGHLLNRLLSQRSSSDNVSKQVRDFVAKTVDAIELFETDVLCNENDGDKGTDMPEISDINSLDKFVTDKQANLSEDESQDGKTTIAASAKRERLESNDDANTECSLPPDCSEPMEYEQSAELLLDFNENKESKLTKTNKFLKLVMEFAKTLYNDCGTFMSATTDVDDKVAIYLQEQMQKFKTIAFGENCVDKAMQTEKQTTSKRKLMNNKAKQKLIADCIYSSDTDSESSSSVYSQSTSTSLDSTAKLHDMKQAANAEQLAKHDSVNNAQEYDDGIDISKYIQSDIFDSVCPNSPSAQSGSDKENKKHKSESSGDDTDKEIERLTNLSGLVKRQPFTTAKYTQSDKQKSKTLSQKNNNIIDFSDDETENYNCNKSILENEEEIITENEFKSRCNADVKRQLLNDSSSDSDEPEQSDSDLANKLTSDEEDADTALLVDKFLETYTVDLSDAEECAEEYEEKSTKTPKSAENESQSSDCVKGQNDFDYLNEKLDHKRKGKSKTLEKMLLEAEKRNNTTNEEIVLSSESDYSDVEAVDVEPVEEKSRAIKAMLRPDQLANETRKAQKLETERIRKLDKQQGILSKALKQHKDQVAEGEVILDYLEDSKVFIKVDPAIVVHLKTHQIDGVKFMYESCYCGAISSAKNPGSGCILAHCMGLGKTLQLIALIHTVVSYPQLKTNRVLVLCPKSTVMNWADEMQRWLGPYQKDKHLKVFVFTEPSDISEKLQVLEEWAASTSKRAGCLLLGYEAFRTLVFYHSYKTRLSVTPQRLQEIKEKIDKYLLEPGADLAVCDEGHIIKNSKSAISLAVAKIKTPRRIILTGTPIQNNLKEYYSMVNFIKPLYLGTEKEFANLYANPIKNGQHKDSSKQDIKVMKQRSFVLHKKLSKFVQRKEAELLKTFLPSKFEYVLFVPMTTVQKKLYEHIIGAISTRGDNRGKSLITDYTCLRKIWTHPKVLQDAWKNATDQKNKNDARKAQASAAGAGHSDDDQPDDIYDSQTGVMSVTNDWWRHLLTNKDLETIMPSNKMRAMFEILRMCEEKGEKCLIFSAFVAVLNVVEYFFNKITNKDPEMLQQISSQVPSSQKVSNMWISGQDYYRLDGKTPKAIRHEMIKRFNSATNMRARVFLISSKAGGQGINLTGANRVIILDTSWNPSNDQQNIFRIFRLGQKRNCYIYRLLAMGTMEEKVYSRSVTKQAMSFRVVDEQQIDRHYNMAELAELYCLTDIKDSDRPMPILPKDSILASLLMNHPDIVYKYHEHDSLLENKVEQELSEQEKADAWATYERELQMNMETQEMPNMDRMQNNLFAAKMPNYNGSIPGLDMQALLNYGMFSSQAAPMMSSFPTNYATSANQYLEALYRNFSLGYPDLTPPLHGSNPYAPSYGSVNQSPKPLTAANMNPLHVVPSATTNPLSALSDLGMLGMHPQKLFNNPAAATVAPIHAGHVNSSYPATSMQSNTSLPLSTKPLNAPYGPYAPVHRTDNSHASYFNFVNEFSGLLNPLSTTVTQQSALDLPQPSNLQKTTNPVQEPLPAHMNLISKQAPAPPSSVEKHQQKEKSATPTDYMSLSTKKPENAQNTKQDNVNQTFHNPPTPTKHLQEQKTAQAASSLPPPLIQKTAVTSLASPLIQKTTATSLPASSTNKTTTTTALPASTASPMVNKRPGNFTAYPKSTLSAQRPKNVPPALTNVAIQKKAAQSNMPSANDKAVNIGIHYPQLKENNNTKDFMKSTSEMQIIPTTSPPGTSSISKQFLEISPSISLTAVRNSNTKTLPAASTGGSVGVSVATIPKTTIQKQNFNTNISKGNTNSTTSGNGLIISKAVNKTAVVKGVPNTMSGSSGGVFTPTALKSVTSGVSVTAKAAAASMVLAKATGAMANVKPADVHKLPTNLSVASMKVRTAPQKGNVSASMPNLNVQSTTVNKDTNPTLVYSTAGEGMKKVNVIANNAKLRGVVPKANLQVLANKASTTPMLDMRGTPIKSGTVAGLTKVYERKRNGDEIKHLPEAKIQKLSHEPK